jgi:predicted branched-subunit amino acid permease
MNRAVLSTSISVGLATGLYGISFGALAAAAGFDLVQIILLSTLMFSGGSQFAFIAVVASGGTLVGATSTAWLLGVRNGFYALRMAPVLGPLGLTRVLAAQFSIDESTAVALAQPDQRRQRLGFWATGAAVFVFWNLATVFGALLGDLVADPRDWGLDAAAAAAFLALIWPRLNNLPTIALAGLAAFLAVSLSPILPAGFSILAAALIILIPFFRRATS